MATEFELHAPPGPFGPLAGLLSPGSVKMGEKVRWTDLEVLVEENLKWLRGWLRGQVSDPDLVDDLCQESFLKAVRKISGLKDPSNFSGWLFKIAQNTLRDHFRREARRQKRVQFTDQMDRYETSVEPPDSLGNEEEAEKLLRGIRALPPRLQEPLLLRHSRNLSYAEIGKILNISENAVQVRVFRARQKLRKTSQKGLRKGTDQKGARKGTRLR